MIHAAILQDNNINGAPVLSPDKKLIGVITTSDLISGLDIESESPADKLFSVLVKKGRSKKLGSVVDDLMTANPITITPETYANDAAAVMSEHDINRLVVTNGDQRVIGILSRTDLLKVYT